MSPWRRSPPGSAEPQLRTLGSRSTSSAVAYPLKPTRPPNRTSTNGTKRTQSAQRASVRPASAMTFEVKRATSMQAGPAPRQPSVSERRDLPRRARRARRDQRTQLVMPSCRRLETMDGIRSEMAIQSVLDMERKWIAACMGADQPMHARTMASQWAGASPIHLPTLRDLPSFVVKESVGTSVASGVQDACVSARDSSL